MVLYKHNDILNVFDHFFHKLSNGDTGIPVETRYLVTNDSIRMILFIDIFEDFIRLFLERKKSDFLYLSIPKLNEIKKSQNILKFLQYSDDSIDQLTMEILFDKQGTVKTYHNQLRREVEQPITYDAHDMLELFWIEEETLQKTASHHAVHYSRRIDGLTIEFQFDILQNTVDIKVYEKEHMLLASTMNNVTRLDRDENTLIIYRNEIVLATISLKDKIHVTYPSELDYR